MTTHTAPTTDRAGHDHAGHDHAGHDRAGHDHAGHDHRHPDGHDHDHGSGAHRAFGGPVTVDVGGGAGALVLVLDDDWLGDEIHLRAPDGDTRTHTGVWARPMPSGDLVAAVFGSLDAGRYAVLDHDRVSAITEVDVLDGGVVERDLRSLRA